MTKIDFYCIGYSGRDIEKTREHVEELKKIGVPEPKSIPEIYHLKNNLLTRSDNIEVIGDKTSGEVEVVLIADSEGQLFVTVGSDHTDRGLETVSIHKSKQICDKPIASEKWKLENIEEEWEKLELYSEVKKEGEWIKYQKGTLSSIISLDDIISFLEKNDIELKNVVVFCGTVPLSEGFIYGDVFKCGIKNHKNKESIELKYNIERLRE